MAWWREHTRWWFAFRVVGRLATHDPQVDLFERAPLRFQRDDRDFGVEQRAQDLGLERRGIWLQHNIPPIAVYRRREQLELRDELGRRLRNRNERVAPRPTQRLYVQLSRQLSIEQDADRVA